MENYNLSYSTVPLARLTIYHFRQKLSRPIHTTMGALTYRPALLMKIEDVEGAYGWGEIWCNFPPEGDLYRKRLAENIIPAALVQGTFSGSPFASLQVRLLNLSLQAGEPGPLAQICAAADIALSDLAARRNGISLTRFLGGEDRNVPTYASGISPELWEEQIDRMRAKGYQHFKLRIGFGPEDGIPVAKALSDNLASGETLRVDANQAWTVETAMDRVNVLQDLPLEWLEEPLPANASKNDWHRLAQSSQIPLAAGENLRHRDDFVDMIARGDISVIQPDACKWGGVSGVLDIARKARNAGRLYCPHYLGGGVGLMASAHLLAAIGGDGLLEVDSSENMLNSMLAAHDGQLVDGQFIVPQKPGLGYDPDIRSASDMLEDEIECMIG